MPMDPEPNQPMEEVLKAYAAKRREEAGDTFELHPATRRLLQGEVSRQFSKNERDRKKSGSWLSLFGPRLVFSSGIFAVLIVISVLLFQPPVKKQEVAMGRRLSEKETEEIKKATPLPASTESKNADRARGFSDALGDKDQDTRFGEAAADRREVRTSSRLQTLADPAEVKLELAKERDFKPAPKGQSDIGGSAGGLKMERTITPVEPSANSPADETKLGNKVMREKILADAPDGLLADAKDLKKQSASFGLEPPATPSVQPNKSEDLYLKETALKRAAITAPSITSAPPSSEAKPAPTRVADLGTLGASIEPVNRNLAIVGEANALADTTSKFFETSENQRQTANSYFFVQTLDAGVTQLEARRHRFSTVANDVASNKVLAAFHFQVTGDQVTIVDSDGSTYRGEPVTDQPANLSWAARSQSATTENLEKSKSAMKPQSSRPADGNVWFKVSGTNRTLNQLVTVRGLFTPSPTNPTTRADELNRSRQESQSRALNRPLTTAPAAVPALQKTPASPGASASRGQVQGKVEIGQQILDFKAVESPQP